MLARPQPDQKSGYLFAAAGESTEAVTVRIEV
jgi:hypothetical protein